MEHSDKLVVFQEKEIRRIWHKEEWYFSIVDVVGILSDSPIPRTYWSKLKARILVESELNPNWVQLKMMSADGKSYKQDATNTEGMFRIIQSIPSPKAEPFKLWLAKVGYDRILEIENPELAAQRARQNYKDLGYDEVWIEKRLQSIAIRGQLTDEWENRGVKEGQEYAILTAEISKATFGLTPTEHKKVKELNKENLRDHMTELELIFTMLGEVGTRKEAEKKDAQGFFKNKEAATEGGAAAGDALQAYEKRTGDKVVTHNNFKPQIAAAKKKQKALIPPKK
jgi:DNA-damage-inducible protein D